VALPQPLEAAVLSLAHEAQATDLVLDGELIGHKLYVFDLLQLGPASVCAEPASSRWQQLQALFASLPEGHAQALALVAPATTEAGKRALLEDLRAHEQEGIVFKRADAPYVHGRPNSGGTQLKYKFIDSATLQEAAVNGAKRSVSLQGFDAAGAAVALGQVTIPPNVGIPAPGAIVEVRYLYAYPGGSLFQPVYRGERADQTVEACGTAQLKYKAAHRDGAGRALA
jgi:bifunctional non-homologous end joining protein LigD